MSKFWQTKQFKDLLGTWNKKLEDSGFEDAEKEVNGETVLKQTSLNEGRFIGVYRNASDFDRQEKEEYFRILYQLASQEQNFEDELDKIIMERTAEGKTIKEISDELKSNLPEGKQRGKFNRNTIRYVRRRYESRWGIRVWKREDMISRKKPPSRS